MTTLQSRPDRVAGGPGAPRRRRPRLRWSVVLQLLAVLVVAFIVLRPLAILFWGALRSASPGAPGAAYSLEPLRAVYTGWLSGSPVGDAVLNSLVISALVTALSLAAGIGFTWLVSRTDIRLRGVIGGALLLPILYSSLVGIIGWTTLFAPRSGLLNQAWRGLTGTESNLFNIYTYAGVILVMTLHFVPYVVLIVGGAMRSMNAELEEAAEIGGATRVRTLRSVTLPLLLPATAAAGLFVFVISMELFSVPYVLGSRIRLTTLATEIYLNVRGRGGSAPNLPVAAATGTLLLGITLVLLFTYRRLGRRLGRYTTVSARGFRTGTTRLGRWRLPATLLALGYVLLTTVLPLSGVVLRSLIAVRSTTIDVAELSLENYRELLASPNLGEALRTSAALSFGGALLALMLATVVAVWKTRRRSVLSGAADYILTVPVAVPGLLLGLGFVWAYVASPLYATIWLMLLVVVVRYVGIGIQSVGAGLVQTDAALAEAAVVAGASEPRVLRTITLPLMRPALVSVTMLLILTIGRELSASVLLYGPGSRTLPILTWELLTDAVWGSASALAVLQVLAIGALAVFARVVFKLDMKSLMARN